MTSPDLPWQVNHTKLLFPTAARYEDARLVYLDKLVSKFTSVRDEAIAKELPVREQRLFVETMAEEVEEASLRGGSPSPDGASPDASPATRRGVSPVEEGRSASPAPGEGAGKRPPLGGKRGSVAGGTPRQGGTPRIAPETARAAASADVPAAPAVPVVRNSSLKVLDQVIDQNGGPADLPAPVVVLTGGKAEHELLCTQSLYMLASKLRDGGADLGPIRLVPLVLSMTKLHELLLDEAMAKKPPREVLIRCFELP